MGLFNKLLGTTLSKFQIGIGGPQLKNNAGVLEARNAADGAYAAISAALVNIYGNDFVINKGATESGDSWILTISRPSTGMTEDVQIILPPDAAPSPGQAMTVETVSGGVITMQWASVAAGTDLTKVDTTSLAFGTTSPLALFTLAADMVILKVQVIVDTPFTGGTGPSLSIGVSGTASKYMGATDVDLTAAASTVFEVNPGSAADGSSEDLIATYAANSATDGAARILVHYCDPS